jgi:hypothetical protein
MILFSDYLLILQSWWNHNQKVLHFKQYILHKSHIKVLSNNIIHYIFRHGLCDKVGDIVFRL